MATVGERIRTLREASGISQRKVALALGMSNSTLSKYEAGILHIHADWLPTIAQVVGCSPCDFFDDQEPATFEQTIADALSQAWERLPVTEQAVIERLIAAREHAQRQKGGRES